MIKNPVVFIADDYVLNDNFSEIEEILTKKGVQVIRGPKTIPGTKLEYAPEDYERLFSKAHVLMFSSRSICDKNVVAAAKNAIAFINPSCGMETVDLEEITQRGIIAGNGAIPQNVNSVAEASICAMLMLSQNTMKSINSVKSGNWKNSAKHSWSRMFSGSTVGIIGFGNIGKLAAERLQNFGVRILAYSPHLTKETAPSYVEVATLEQIYKESDFISLYVNINKDTYNMINKDTLAMMKPTAYIINTARGEAIEEDALYDALKNGKIAGAALDTYHIEPLPWDSKLRELDNVILTPHMAGATYDNYCGITEMAVKNIMKVLNGELPVYVKNGQIAEQWLNKMKERETS